MAGGPAFLRPVNEFTTRLCYVNFDGKDSLEESMKLGLDQPLPDDFMKSFARPVFDGTMVSERQTLILLSNGNFSKFKIFTLSLVLVFPNSVRDFFCNANREDRIINIPHFLSRDAFLLIPSVVSLFNETYRHLLLQALKNWCLNQLNRV